MDIDSFRDGEQFSTFDTHNFMDLYPDDSTSLDTPQNFHQTDMYQWNMDVEREINGDIALIPMCDIPISMLNDSSPNSDEFQRIINDWQQFICPDLINEEFRIEDPIIIPEENEDETIQQISSPLNDRISSPLNDLLNIPDVESFDLTSYIAADESTFSTNPVKSTSSTTPIQCTSSTKPQRTSSKTLIHRSPSTNPIQSTSSMNRIQSTSCTKPWTSISESKIKAPVKKIDLKAQRYIAVDEDEDDIDVETVSENEENGDNSAVLEACDLNSLLEQFEATVPDLPLNFIENNQSLFDMQIEPNGINFTSDASRITPSNLKVEQMHDTVVKIKEEQIDIGKTVLSLPKAEQKCNIVVKTEKKQIDNESPVLLKLDIKNVKKEFEDFNIVKVKNEPTSGKKKTKNKIKMNRENIKTENETVIQQKTCRVKVEPFVPISEIKHRKAEQVKQTTRLHGDTKQNNEKQITSNLEKPLKYEFTATLNKASSLKLSPTSAYSNPEKTLKYEFTPTLNKASSPKQPSPPGQCNVQNLIHKSPESTTSPTRTEPAENKHIIDSLPQELIARIKESGKRKTISVIPPIPAKKRGGPRIQESSAQVVRNKANKNSREAETVQLDHDYCSLASPYPKHIKKEPGSDSADEDDRPIIGKQPTVKNADGKLMVSLLKVNTIHSKESNQKKKLNLEEYKKRRVGFMKTQNNSQSCSPISSTCNSPLPEDENTRRIRHQEKLMKMALEVLNTPPKPEKKPELPLVVTPPPPIKIPVDIEKKTLVSIGVNTDFNVRRHVEVLEKIKPILKKASDMISHNSLITGVIENVPKFISTCDEQTLKANPQENKFEHGEDKTIVYLPKNRAATKTRSIECQTNLSLIQQTKASRYRRRRTSSSSSCSSDSSSKSRKSRTSSRYSRRRNSDSSRSSSRSSRSSNSCGSHSSSSSYSSRSSNRSRSRSSSSPRYSSKEKEHKEKERLLEVEERRVIYVGRISPGISRDDLRKRFNKFGPITNISLHSRSHGYLDNYGFVTFANKLDAYEAIEHGNDDPWQPKYDLSFGGRRIFCQTTYSDLDNMRDESGYFAPRGTEDSFDALLRDVQEKLRKRKV